MSFDINRLLKKHRKRALKFWSKVDIGSPDECWNWQGTINEKTKQPQFAWRRHGISSSTQHHPQRIAMWFTWGDLGFTGVKTTCGNKYCCNPFHLIPQHIGVYVDNDSYIESFELQCRSSADIDPDTGFGDRFEAVMLDLLNGTHITQTEPDDPGLYREPTDNEDDPTQDF